MTLKEKFIKSYRKVFSVENLAEESEKIADEFAIDFVVWLDKNKKELRRKVLIEELLTIYKEEKGL